MKDRKTAEIKKSVLIPLGLVLLLLIGLAIAGAGKLQRQHIDDDMWANIKGVEHLFQILLEEEAVLIGSLIESYTDNNSLQTAYLAKEAFFPLHENAGNSSIELKEFSYGKMVFDFSGNNEEFLVIADAWHPFWKAYAGDTSLPVVKANEIFKGVRLPKGKYTLIMEFDTSPYSPGVYVSIIFWILFLSGLFWVYFRCRHKKFGKC